MNNIETPEGYRQWATEHHPCVVAALAKGEAMITCAPGGFMWFGPEDGVVEISPLFVRYATARSRDMWPPQSIAFGEFEMERVDQAENGNGLYKRVKADGKPASD